METQRGGVSYIRWGRTLCNDTDVNATTIYSGKLYEYYNTSNRQNELNLKSRSCIIGSVNKLRKSGMPTASNVKLIFIKSSYSLQEDTNLSFYSLHDMTQRVKVSLTEVARVDNPLQKFIWDLYTGHMHLIEPYISIFMLGTMIKFMSPDADIA